MTILRCALGDAYKSPDKHYLQGHGTLPPVHATPSPPHETLYPGMPGTLYPAFKPGLITVNSSDLKPDSDFSFESREIQR